MIERPTLTRSASLVLADGEIIDEAIAPASSESEITADPLGITAVRYAEFGQLFCGVYSYYYLRFSEHSCIEKAISP